MAYCLFATVVKLMFTVLFDYLHRHDWPWTKAPWCSAVWTAKNISALEEDY